MLFRSREPDSVGNYVNNHEFAIQEELTDDINWKFLLALGGEGDAKITDGTIEIVTRNQGTVDYSVQLVQADIPMEIGATYELSFDAYASEPRNMKTCVTAPDYGYTRYFQDTIVNLGTEKSNYVYSFYVKDNSDANGRIEFNLGACNSAATVWITNVIIKKLSTSQTVQEEKTILADGNFIYNGAFQEGNNRLAYWEIMNDKNAQIHVTNLNNNRYLIRSEEHTSELQSHS